MMCVSRPSEVSESRSINTYVSQATDLTTGFADSRLSRLDNVENRRGEEGRREVLPLSLLLSSFLFKTQMGWICYNVASHTEATIEVV